MTDHQQAALTAMQDEIYRQLNCQYGDFNIPSNEEVKAILAAAEPHLRKKVRAEVVAEIRASLPRDLAAGTQDRDGWFSGMTGDLNIVVEVDEDMTPVGYGFELEAATGTIDLHHLADIAARIAEGVEEAGIPRLYPWGGSQAPALYGSSSVQGRCIIDTSQTIPDQSKGENTWTPPNN